MCGPELMLLHGSAHMNPLNSDLYAYLQLRAEGMGTLCKWDIGQALSARHFRRLCGSDWNHGSYVSAIGERFGTMLYSRVTLKPAVLPTGCKALSREK